MPYPEIIVKPMREELTRAGVIELRDAASVDAAFAGSEGKTQLLIINSICGCAAANARPAVIKSRQAGAQPDEFLTVFAGQDLDATDRAREHLAGIPPSSPFIALFRDGDPVFVLERRHIEGRSGNELAEALISSYEKFCGNKTSGSEEEPRSDTESQLAAADPGESSDELPPTFRSIL